MEIIIDPNKEFNFSHPSIAINMLGLIPSFIDQTLSFDDMVEYAMGAYGYGGPPMTGHTIDENLVMHYPGDPELNPVAVIMTIDAQVIIYQYGIVTFLALDGEKEITYRMD